MPRCAYCHVNGHIITTCPKLRCSICGKYGLTQVKCEKIHVFMANANDLLSDYIYILKIVSLLIPYDLALLVARQWLFDSNLNVLGSSYHVYYGMNIRKIKISCAPAYALVNTLFNLHKTIDDNKKQLNNIERMIKMEEARLHLDNNNTIIKDIITQMRVRLCNEYIRNKLQIQREKKMIEEYLKTLLNISSR